METTKTTVKASKVISMSAKTKERITTVAASLKGKVLFPSSSWISWDRTQGTRRPSRVALDWTEPLSTYIIFKLLATKFKIWNI